MEEEKKQQLKAKGGGEVAKATSKVGNSISICSVNAKGKEEKVISTLSGTNAEKYLGDLEAIVNVSVRFEERFEVSDEQVLECLKNTTFTNDGFSSGSPKNVLKRLVVLS